MSLLPPDLIERCPECHALEGLISHPHGDCDHCNDGGALDPCAVVPVDVLRDADLHVAVGKVIEAEVHKRNEWYGLDNWTSEEVAEFALEAAAAALARGSDA